MELAEGRDVVEAGIGAGIRDHDEPVPHQNSATIGHSMSPNRLNSGGQLVANFREASNPHSPRQVMLPMAKKGPPARAGASTRLDWRIGRGTGRPDAPGAVARFGRRHRGLTG